METETLILVGIAFAIVFAVAYARLCSDSHGLMQINKSPPEM